MTDSLIQSRDVWRREYASMTARHNRELRRVIALADLFEDWLVEHGTSRFEAGQIASRLYAEATEMVDA